ncbi:MAG: DUF1524 domain-containing protein, partial [Anaeroplasmataceae bacterium]|nr:DUF1524 domain-containing protein [Anaeroplasmataceae bacterium]
INWSNDIEGLLIEFNSLFKLISEMNFFKYFKPWKTNLRTLMSDAVMLNFILLIRLDWIAKGKSISDNNAKKVQKNAFILFDRMIYEYTTRQWRGSSDSKISKNIDKFSSLQSSDGLFVPISQEKWSKLILEILENNKVEDEFVDQQTMTPILYYYYCLKRVAGPNDIDTFIEVDHIIPQTKFDNSTIIGKEYIKHNLFNLALMPKKDNISKSNKTLKQIDDPWLKNQICTYEEINIEDFEKYSDLNNFNELRNLRGEKIKSTFNEERKKYLNN